MIADALTLLLAKATLILIAGFALDVLMRRHSAAARAALWNGVLLVLAVLPIAHELMPRWQWPLAAQTLDANDTTIVPVAPPPIVAQRPLPELTPRMSAPLAVPEGPRITEPVALAPTRSLMNDATWRSTLLGLYVIGVGVMLTRLASSFAAERAIRRSAFAINSGLWADGLRRCLMAMGMPSSVRLLLTDRVTVPCALGVHDRAVAIPARLASAERDVIDSVLFHELAHLARGDIAWLLLQRLLEAFLWFHPLIWMASRRIAFVRDRVCDEYVIHALGDAHAYARTLVELSAHAGTRRPLACGLAVVRSSKLSRRVDALLASRGDPRLRIGAKAWWPLAGASVLGVMALAALEFVRSDAVAQKADASPPPLGSEPMTAAVSKANAEAEKFVRQLGSPLFAKRQAAEKALQGMGARAATAVATGFRDGDLEVVRRCEAVWRQLWQTEMGRPHAERLDGFDHPVWSRFRKTVGDDSASRGLFIDMVADISQFKLLENAEADPAKANDFYNAELKRLVERAKQAWREADQAAGGRSGVIWPIPGIPNRGEHAALLFLGTYPATAADSARDNDGRNQYLYRSVIGTPLDSRPDRNDRQGPADIPPPVRRLFATWLKTRTDPNLIAIGMHFAIYDKISEAHPAARANAANAKLDPHARGFAVLAVGELGSRADFDVLANAFSDTRVFYPTAHPAERDNLFETQVADTAIAAVLYISGKHPGEFGFPQLAGQSGPFSLARFQVLGFGDDRTRQAAHKKAQEWIARYQMSHALHQMGHGIDDAPLKKPDPDVMSEEPVNDPAYQGMKISVRRRKLTVTGRALDAGGRPVAGARIYLASPGPEVIGKTTADNNGRYEIRDAPLTYHVAFGIPGGAQFQVFGTAPTHAFSWSPVKDLFLDARRVPGESPDAYFPGDRIAIDLAFQAPKRIEGKVINEKGEAIAGVKVVLSRCDYADTKGRTHTSIDLKYQSMPTMPNFEPLDFQVDAVTDAQGRFELGSIPTEAICEIKMSHPDHADVQLYTTSAANAPKTFNKQPIAQLPLQLTLPTLRSVVVEVRSAQTNVLFEGSSVWAEQVDSVAQHSASTRTDKSGRATLKLPPGKYQLKVTPGSGAPNLSTAKELIVEREPRAQSVAFLQPEGCVLILKAVDAVTGEALPNVMFQYERELGKKDMTFHSSNNTALNSKVFQFLSYKTDHRGEMHARVPAGKRLYQAIRLGGNGEDPKDIVSTLERVLELQDGQTVSATFALPGREKAPPMPKKAGTP